MRGRPRLFVDYRTDQAPLNTNPKRFWFAIGFVLVALLPFVLADGTLRLMGSIFAAAIGAVGLNLLSGYAGQLSLGHAFFIGIGAYTGAVIGGVGEGRLLGFGVTNLFVVVLAAGAVAAIIGVAVGPVATRLKGLYLAIVTLGLVFIGEHLFREFRTVTGGAGMGRRAARLELFGLPLSTSSEVMGVQLTGGHKMYWVTLVLLCVFAVLASNVARSAVGRAFAAVRDRDIAALLMGVNLNKYKLMAFGLSSFYAGVAGALMASTWGFIEPQSYNFFMAIQFIAMILIGGMATISGGIMGAAFILGLGTLMEHAAPYIPYITTSPTGGFLSVFQAQAMLYGLAIVLFMIFEPRGLFGIWVRVRNYWSQFPFSY